MVDQHVRGEPLEDPLMLEPLFRRHPLLGVPLQAAADKVDERVVRRVS